jgi:hypothetical protein
MKTGLNLDFECKGTIFFLYTQDFFKKSFIFFYVTIYITEK